MLCGLCSFLLLQIAKETDNDPKNELSLEFAKGRCYAYTVPEELTKARTHLERASSLCETTRGCRGTEMSADIDFELGGICRLVYYMELHIQHLIIV